MYEDLKANKLTVELIPAREGDGKIRVATWENPEWYKWLCSRHNSERKRKNRLQDTKIKRKNILCTLKAMAEGRRTSSKYVAELKEAAKIYEETWLKI